MVIDSHIHLTHASFSNTFPCLAYNGSDMELVENVTRDSLVAQMQSAGIALCIEPGVSLDSNLQLLALSENLHGFVYPAIGVHPTRTHHFTRYEKGTSTVCRLKLSAFSRLATYAEHPSVVAIGETGLDYHLDKKEQHRLTQKIWFVRQLKLAHKLNLPVILHIRSAHEDALKILHKYRHILHGGVCHCFYGDAQLAKAYTDLGFTLGIGASLLQRPDACAELEEAVRQTPLEALLLETDGPFVKPYCPNMPGKWRRKARNSSLILPAVAKRIAELKGISQEEVERATSENTLRVFHISLHLTEIEL